MRARLRRGERFLMPGWLSGALVLLGAVFVVGWPLGIDWYSYGACRAAAAAFGWLMWRRYETIVLERGPEGVVLRYRRRARGEPRCREPRRRPVLPARQRVKRFLFGLVAWFVLLLALIAAPPEQAAEWAAGLYLLGTVVGLPFLVRYRRKNRAYPAAAPSAAISEAQDVRHWT
jgi:hypothetical protein